MYPSHLKTQEEEDEQPKSDDEAEKMNKKRAGLRSVVHSFGLGNGSLFQGLAVQSSSVPVGRNTQELSTEPGSTVHTGAGQGQEVVATPQVAQTVDKGQQSINKWLKKKDHAGASSASQVPEEAGQPQGGLVHGSSVLGSAGTTCGPPSSGSSSDPPATGLEQKTPGVRVGAKGILLPVGPSPSKKTHEKNKAAPKKAVTPKKATATTPAKKKTKPVVMSPQKKTPVKSKKKKNGKASPKKKKTHSAAESSSKPSRAKRGTMGTFGGRRPPQKSLARKRVFEQMRQEYHQSRAVMKELALPKATKKKRVTSAKQREYSDFLCKRLKKLNESGVTGSVAFKQAAADWKNHCAGRLIDEHPAEQATEESVAGTS